MSASPSTIPSPPPQPSRHGFGFRNLLPVDRPGLILAPMQDVTDLPFWTVIHPYGGPDIYFTEYFRVHLNSKPERHILKALDENPTGRPAIAQMIGQDIPHLIRTARELQRHPIAGIDLNLGCPAPIVCRKDAGGGLLRNPGKVDAILAALRDAIEVSFTVKTRVGYDCHTEFDRLLEVFAKHPIDALTIHGRTVKEKYKSPIHYAEIRKAVDALDCPVVANGNIVSVRMAGKTLAETGAAALMIGRGAIRNPWIFAQCRSAASSDQAGHAPSLRDLLGYIRALHSTTRAEDPEATDLQHTTMMKRYMNFIATGLSKGDALLNGIRRSTGSREFFDLCEQYLDSDAPMPDEPPVTSAVFAGLAAQ
ncbi:MAG: tRNA-dihydrouridine synthase family protein [Verrucomicrobiales bacterium]